MFVPMLNMLYYKMMNSKVVLNNNFSDGW